MNYIQVFVYGTLKPGEVNYQFYCAEYVVQFFPAVAKGLLYKLPVGYPAMTKGNSNVYGFVLSFQSPKVLSKLDKLEDYSGLTQYRYIWCQKLSFLIYCHYT